MTQPLHCFRYSRSQNLHLTYTVSQELTKRYSLLFSSIQISHSVVSDSLGHHESQHARPPCQSPTPGVHSDSHLSSQWCHPAISSSVVPFSSSPQPLPASESFPMSQLVAWGGQSTGVSALASFLPKKSQGWSTSEWIGWISLQSKGLSRVFSNTTVQKHHYTLVLIYWLYIMEHLIFIWRLLTEISFRNKLRVSFLVTELNLSAI